MSSSARLESVSLEEWELLPWLVSRSTAMTLTGLSSDELTAEVQAGRLHMWRPPKGGYGKFFKAELASLCRLDEGKPG